MSDYLQVAIRASIQRTFGSTTDDLVTQQRLLYEHDEAMDAFFEFKTRLPRLRRRRTRLRNQLAKEE